MKKLNNKKGFTIVELVIVIAVIGILAGVLIPTFSGVINKANENKDMQAARNAYENYLVDHAENMESINLCIHSGSHYYHVTAGQFNTVAAADNHSDESDVVKMTVVKEALETESSSTPSQNEEP